METEEQQLEPVETQPGGSSRSLRNALIVVGVVLVVGVGYFFTHRPTDPQAAARAEGERIVSAVGKLMVLPSDEQPIIATVKDPSQLAKEAFFANAKQGDVVLIFNAAHKAVLYRPSDNKIVDVAPLSIGQPSPTPKK